MAGKISTNQKSKYTIAFLEKTQWFLRKILRFFKEVLRLSMYIHVFYVF